MPAVLVVHTGELGELLATQFEQYGLRCCHARTGEEALEQALHAKPTAVVVDSDLPDVGGLELAELLKTELNVPVIVTYGRALELGEAGSEFVARAAKLDGAFAKPFRSLALIGTVADLIGRPLDPAPTSQEGFPIDDVIEVGDDDVLLLEDIIGDAVEQVLDADPHALDVALSLEGKPLEGKPLEGKPVEHDDPFGDLEVEMAIGAADDAPGFEETSASFSLSEFVSKGEASDPAALALLWKKVQQRPQPVKPVPARPGSRGELPLTARSLTETLDAFHLSQSSGEIWMVDGNVRRALLLVGGVLVGARSNAPTEELARLCVRKGWLSPIDAREALLAVKAKEAKDLATAILQITRRRKTATEAQMRTLLGERVKRVVCGAFLAAGGRLKVTHQGHGDRETLPLAVNIADAVTRAIILTEPIEALRQAAPDDARFAPDVGSAYGLDQLQLTAPEAYLVVAMDGTKTIADLRTLHDKTPERTLLGLPSALTRIGLVRLAGRGHAEPKRISFF